MDVIINSPPHTPVLFLYNILHLHVMYLCTLVTISTWLWLCILHGRIKDTSTILYIFLSWFHNASMKVVAHQHHWPPRILAQIYLPRTRPVCSCGSYTTAGDLYSVALHHQPNVIQLYMGKYGLQRWSLVFLWKTTTPLTMQLPNWWHMITILYNKVAL